jgi:hypothetical protein
MITVLHHIAFSLLLRKVFLTSVPSADQIGTLVTNQPSLKLHGLV